MFMSLKSKNTWLMISVQIPFKIAKKPLTSSSYCRCSEPYHAVNYPKFLIDVKNCFVNFETESLNSTGVFDMEALQFNLLQSF